MKALFDEYTHLKNYPHTKKGKQYWQPYDTFVKTLADLFDILASSERIKAQEVLWNLKMTDTDWVFYKKQKEDGTGKCEGFVDRKWMLSNKRKHERQQRKRSEYYEFTRETVVDDCIDIEISDTSDLSYSIDNDNSASKNPNTSILETFVREQISAKMKYH